MTKIPQTTSAKALHVGVVREGRFIEDRWFQGEVNVTVGTGAKNTFALPLSSLPASLPLFAHKQGRVVLQFDEKARGKLTLSKRELELAECRKEGLAAPRGGLFELPLASDARGRITLGEVSFVFNFAAPPPVPPKPVLPKEAQGTLWNVTDHTFVSILMVSLVLHGCVIAAISRRDLPPEDTTMADIPDRIVHMLVPEKPPEEPEKPKEDEKPPEEEAPKEEKKEVKKEEAPKDSAEHKAAVANAVKDKGLLRILASNNGGAGSALGQALSGDSGFEDISQALNGAQGVAIAGENGSPSRKGEGAAGSAAIGDLKTGGGSGGKLREKRDVAVSSVVETEEAEVDSPSVDKDALARFIKLRINSIRGCYEAQLKRSPNLKGKVVVTFTINSRGGVSEASVGQDSMGSDEVASCIVRLIKTWKLPFKPESDTAVSFPFLFSPAN